MCRQEYLFHDIIIKITEKRSKNDMGRNRTERNTLNFKKNFFLLLAQQKLTPCEYKCLLVLLEGAEQTKTQIAKILSDTPQHVGTADTS